MTRILVGEDDPDLARALDNDLRLDGYDVELKVDCESASRRAREQTFDLILVDVIAPHKDGFEVCGSCAR